MKSSELRGMADDQLVTTLGEIEKHLFQLRFQSATDRLEAPSEINKAKKDIARVKTEQRRRELAKLSELPAEALVASLSALSLKTEGPGKRRAKRDIARLTALHESKTPAQAQPAAQTAKGK